MERQQRDGEKKDMKKEDENDETKTETQQRDGERDRKKKYIE